MLMANDGGSSGFGLMLFMSAEQDGEAERVSRLSRVANLQQPRSTRTSTLLTLHMCTCRYTKLYNLL